MKIDPAATVRSVVTRPVVTVTVWPVEIDVASAAPMTVAAVMTAITIMVIPVMLVVTVPVLVLGPCLG